MTVNPQLLSLKAQVEQYPMGDNPLPLMDSLKYIRKIGPLNEEDQKINDCILKQIAFLDDYANRAAVFRYNTFVLPNMGPG